jgi:hypothetical protein
VIKGSKIGAMAGGKRYLKTGDTSLMYQNGNDFLETFKRYNY